MPKFKIGDLAVYAPRRGATHPFLPLPAKTIVEILPPGFITGDYYCKARSMGSLVHRLWIPSEDLKPYTEGMAYPTPTYSAQLEAHLRKNLLPRPWHRFVKLSRDDVFDTSMKVAVPSHPSRLRSAVLAAYAPPFKRTMQKNLADPSYDWKSEYEARDSSLELEIFLRENLVPLRK